MWQLATVVLPIAVLLGLGLELVGGCNTLPIAVLHGLGLELVSGCNTGVTTNNFACLLDLEDCLLFWLILESPSC